MKDKQCPCTPILLIITTLRLVSASEDPNDTKALLQKYNQGSKLEKIVAMWNKSLDQPHENIFQGKYSSFGPNFAREISNCIEERQYQITENISEGKAIILNCFKTILILNVLKHLGGSRKSNVKLFNGFLEFEKIPEDCDEVSENFEEGDDCVNKYSRNLGADRRKEYVRMYEKAMLKLISERDRLNAYRNRTEKDREKMLNRINENSEAFLSEVIRSIGNEEEEKAEEEKIKREIADPKLLAILDEVSKNYMLKLRFYPGMAARMMRSRNGGFTFDLELNDSSAEEEEEEQEKEVSSDEESTREIKDGHQLKDFDDEDESFNRIKRKKSKGDKKKKKQKKKKEKKLKKIIPYLLIPMLIQMTLLPFVFKKLFFLAMKALFAGKVALILVGFNLLRNTCIKNDDDVQKIRVEHYGYRKGEEYGAWVNGRSLQESLIMSALNEGFFRGQNSVTF